jgi:hypothetical protein
MLVAVVVATLRRMPLCAPFGIDVDTTAFGLFGGCLLAISDSLLRLQGGAVPGFGARDGPDVRYRRLPPPAV